MDAYVLIGNAHTRKASVLRSLTGCFNRSVREILPLDASAPLRLYARVGSLQDTRTAPADFVDEAARTGRFNCVSSAVMYSILARSAGLEVSDRIALTWAADSTELAAAVAEHTDWIAGEVLATRLIRGAPGSGEQTDVEGHALWVQVQRA